MRDVGQEVQLQLYYIIFWRHTIKSIIINTNILM